MAGDVDVPETLLFSTKTAGAPFPEMEILHDYGPRVQIGIGGGAAFKAPMPGDEIDLSQLTQTERLGLAAFGLRNSGAYREAKSARAGQADAWDIAGRTTPDGGDDGAPAPQIQGAPGPATSERLTGVVSVGIIIVSGPDDGLKFSEDEQTHIAAEVQNGLAYLGAAGPGPVIRWKYDIQHVTIATKPDPLAVNSYEGKEKIWRDPALIKMGYSPGLTGAYQYIEKLRGEHKSDWTYCAFFTKYPVFHFAYANLGGPRLVMEWENDNWGPQNIDRVFAHESGHIFGAPDEYAGAGCNCGGKHGYFKKPNANCISCAKDGGVKCIMRDNAWEMCDHTRYHLGYADLP